MTGEWRHFPTIDPGPVFCALDHEDWPCERERVQLRVEELERRVRDFAATWHLANGHDGRVDDCGWSTCLGLLTGEIERGADLEARRVLEGETS